ncbi:MAG: TonB-dependent receptor [Bacteroidales bacterium]|nr:TonB-dependent receptor [Bacteroidales bacterium]
MASNSYSQETRFSLNLKNVTIKQVLNTIEKKSDFIFFNYDNVVDLNRKVSISVKDKTVSEILNDIFSNTDNSYYISDRQIFITKKSTSGSRQQKPIKKKMNEISGRVTDVAGEALIGAAVIVKGTNNGVTTDVNGMYKIKTEPGVILEVSYIGYKKKNIPLGNKTNVNVILESDNKIDEVVVVGYGLQRKLTLTGSVSSIRTKELKQSAVSNLSNALVGRLPGLIARQSTGEPGADGSSLRLRGSATYSSSNSPLILVDGIPRDGFNYIEPSQIASITILKDASATAIYGVKGANGVVLIETKRGTTGKPKVNITVEQAFRNPTVLLKYLDSYDYLNVYRQGLINDDRISEANIYTNEYISRYKRTSGEPADYSYLYPDVDWTKELLKNVSYRTVANVDVTGGTQNIKYYIAGAFMNDDGLYAHTGDAKGYSSQANEKRFNFRSNLDVQISPWIKAIINLSTIVRRRNYPSKDASDIFEAIRKTPSYVFPMLNPDGTISQSGHSDSNPYGLLIESGYQRMFNSYIQGTAGIEANLDFITPGLAAKIRFSYDAYNYNGYNREKAYASYTYLGNDNYEIYSKGDQFLNYSEKGGDWYNTITPEFFLTYNKKFNADHSISAMLLYRMSNKNKRSSNTVGAIPYREQGLVGRMTYNYKDKYFAEANFGYNGSENFAKGHRFGFFPSLSLSWAISNESFMAKAKSWLNLLKIRASAGQVGNENSGTRFAYITEWNLGDGSYKFGDNYQTSLSGAIVNSAGNKLVTWEKATKYDAGIDLNIKNGLLSFTGDLFFEHRSNIYTSSSATASGLLGLDTYAKINAGVVDNKGLDLEITHRYRINRNFDYTLKGTYTYTRNKVKKCVEAPMSDRPWQSFIGRQIDERYDYVAVGLFKDWNDINNSADQSGFGQIQPGDIKYKDINNDGVINSLDKKYTGKLKEPNQIIGFDIEMRYKNFDFATLFQGAFGRTVYINGTSLFGDNYEMRQIFKDYDHNYWTPEHTNAKYPRAMSMKNTNNMTGSTFWYRSGDYLRLKNIEFGYTLPSRITKKWNISQLRFYINGNNLVTFSGLKLFDPEENDGSPSYPLMRTYNLGLSITF